MIRFLLKVPYDFGDLGEKAKGGHVVNTNHRRVVETWMDSKHKEYFFTRVPLARFFCILTTWEYLQSFYYFPPF